MAVVTGTLVVDATADSYQRGDAHEWAYVGVDGIEHVIKNAEGFKLMIENTASNIKWYIDSYAAGPAGASNYNSMLTYDGYTVMMHADCDGKNETRFLNIAALADGIGTYKLAGELVMSLSDTNIQQRWHCAYFITSDVNMGSSGTIGSTSAPYISTWEDQYGNTMTIPVSGSGLSVAAAT